MSIKIPQQAKHHRAYRLNDPLTKCLGAAHRVPRSIFLVRADLDIGQAGRLYSIMTIWDNPVSGL